MNSIFDKLANSLFQKNSVNECNVEELRSLSEKYPFFNTAQLLLSKKLKDTGNVDYNGQLQKTSLFFRNPLWLDFIINEKKETFSAATPLIEIPVEKIPAPIEDFKNDELVVANPRHDIPVVTVQKNEMSSETGTVIAEKESDSEKDTLVFEPYHTVDYFASQGIKPVLEEKPADKFGLQLKSFTEWLKTLKRTPVQEIEKTVDTVSEEKVVDMAVHSIETREVLTEAMAEVWVKQGQIEKATEIYNKLSLLNPSKSSYFASLIEKLKKH